MQVDRLAVVRRLSPIASPLTTELAESDWRIREPEVRSLAGQELAWPDPAFIGASLAAIDAPMHSRDLVLTEPRALDETPVLAVPQYLHLEVGFPAWSLVDLLEPLSRPGVDGTIFVKREEEVVERGEAQTKTRVEPQKLKLRLAPGGRRGLSVFEMLLPVLMPPAASEFRDELIFPKELYPFQRAGVSWLFKHEAALLADDMGLGKTVQAITAFRALIRRSKALCALVICPKSVLANWLRELERWAPELVAVAIQGSSANRHLAWKAYTRKCHVLVSTYDTILQDEDLLRGSEFDLVVADEVQRIKNPSTKKSRAVCRLRADRRWALTGTPLENKLEDLAAIFEFISPGLLTTRDLQWLSTAAVRERVDPFILRRRKEEALPELPEKVLDTKWLELSPDQRDAYDRAEREGKLGLGSSQNATVPHVLALIQKLKQICNFDPRAGGSSKLEFIVEEYLPEACSEGQKAIVISQYVSALERIAGHVGDYGPLVYKGELSTKQRTEMEQAFESKDEHRVLLLSLKAGGVGINLRRANYVIHFDRWWNPAVERQAEDRTHRIGQQKRVFVTRLICKNTIEERIESLLERKRILFQEVVDELADIDLEHVLSEEELFGLFGLTPPRRRPSGQGAGDRVATEKPAARPTALVINPDEPFSNVVSLRRVLRRCEDFVQWADLHFSARALEELVVTLDPGVVRRVAILSGPANVNEKAKRDFERFREEVSKKGIVAEWRVLPDFAHDRFIITKGACFNVPPVNSLLKGSYSEILETPNRPPFDGWWSKATPI